MPKQEANECAVAYAHEDDGDEPRDVVQAAEQHREHRQRVVRHQLVA